MTAFSQNALSRHHSNAFTLVELLVSVSVLTLLILLVSQLVNSATMATTSSNKHMDADGQARLLLDRMGMDFSRMVKRGDVDYFLKINGATPQAGNDQIAFFSEVPGYSSGSPSPVSLVAYRVNSNFQIERLGKGLLWNGASHTETPMVFLPSTIAATWPAAADATTADSDYEIIGPQVFRFEYYYFLKNGACSANPWDASASTGVNGFRDVAAIAVTIAVIDPKSRGLAGNSQLATLAGQMEDFTNGMKPGALEAQWQDKINASTIPHLATSSVRVYSRFFHLAPSPQ